MTRFLRKHKEQRIHLLHIGKTGGSAIKHVLNDYIETPKYSLELHGHGTSLEDVPRGEAAIFFLRDPISRFISGFYSRQRKGQPRYYSEWSPKEKEIFEYFSSPNEIAVALSNPRSSNHELAIMAMKHVQHFKQYDKWYINFDYFDSRLDDILFIGFQESLGTDFIKLKNILGISEEVNLPTDDVVAHKNPIDIDRSIDKNGIEALQEWYSEDYEFISLCKDLMSNQSLKPHA